MSLKNVFPHIDSYREGNIALLGRFVAQPSVSAQNLGVTDFTQESTNFAAAKKLLPEPQRNVSNHFMLGSAKELGLDFETSQLSSAACAPVPCHRGHRPGDRWNFDTELGGLCQMAMHVAFLYADILRYGGEIPGQPKRTAVFCCTDADTVNVFRVERIEAGAGASANPASTR